MFIQSREIDPFSADQVKHFFKNPFNRLPQVELPSGNFCTFA
jgi:hypothetical protein